MSSGFTVLPGATKTIRFIKRLFFKMGSGAYCSISTSAKLSASNAILTINLTQATYLISTTITVLYINGDYLRDHYLMYIDVGSRSGSGNSLDSFSNIASKTVDFILSIDLIWLSRQNFNFDLNADGSLIFYDGSYDSLRVTYFNCRIWVCPSSEPFYLDGSSC